MVNSKRVTKKDLDCFATKNDHELCALDGLAKAKFYTERLCHNVKDIDKLKEMLYSRKELDGMPIVEMCGRAVTIIPISVYRGKGTKNAVCADCGRPAEVVVYEHKDRRIWFYCGVCEIGG